MGCSSGHPFLLKQRLKKKTVSPVRVDPSNTNKETSMLLWRLEGRVIGQDRALHALIKSLQKFFVNMQAPNRPLAVLLFMGPTGVGKSEMCHALAEVLLDSRNALTRVDCAEFQMQHEIAKLIGSPPGYIGHDKDNARLSQAKLDQYQKQDKAFGRVNILLFDEIEKADSGLYDILLGAMDSGKLTLGNGNAVDLNRTILVMTSNLGSSDTRKIIQGSGIGFHGTAAEREDLDEKIYAKSKEVAKKFFKPEFLNRIDKLIVFRSLSEENLKKVLDIEITKLQRRVNFQTRYIPIRLSNEAKNFLIKEGTSDLYGARELKRAIERFVAEPIANLIGNFDIHTGDFVIVNHEGGDRLVFDKISDPVVYRPVEKSEIETYAKK